MRGTSTKSFQSWAGVTTSGGGIGSLRGAAAAAQLKYSGSRSNATDSSIDHLVFVEVRSSQQSVTDKIGCRERHRYCSNPPHIVTNPLRRHRGLKGRHCRHTATRDGFDAGSKPDRGASRRRHPRPFASGSCGAFTSSHRVSRRWSLLLLSGRIYTGAAPARVQPRARAGSLHWRLGRRAVRYPRVC